VNIGGILLKTVTIYGAINFGAINLLLQKMEQFYGAIIWYHLMATFYSIYVPGFRWQKVVHYMIVHFIQHCSKSDWSALSNCLEMLP